MIRFTVPGEPQGKGRPRFATRCGHAVAYTPPKTAEYERIIRKVYNLTCKGRKVECGAASVEIRAYFGIPKSTPKWKRADMLAGILYPTKKPDADNILKIVLDALNGVAYDDDKQIIEASVHKRYSDNPRVEITISEIKPLMEVNP